jgi:hypothetical protein
MSALSSCRSPEVSWLYFLMNDSLILVDRCRSEVASSPLRVYRADVESVLHLVYECTTPNRELLLRGLPAR